MQLEEFREIDCAVRNLGRLSMQLEEFREISFAVRRI